MQPESPCPKCRRRLRIDKIVIVLCEYIILNQVVLCDVGFEPDRCFVFSEDVVGDVIAAAFEAGDTNHTFRKSILPDRIADSAVDHDGSRRAVEPAGTDNRILLDNVVFALQHNTGCCCMKGVAGNRVLPGIRTDFNVVKTNISDPIRQDVVTAAFVNHDGITCSVEYVVLDPVTVTGIKQAVYAFQNRIFFKHIHGAANGHSIAISAECIPFENIF